MASKRRAEDELTPDNWQSTISSMTGGGKAVAKKRRAEDELTPDNWKAAADKVQPDGGFQKASEEELKTRTFRKARRRLGDAESATPSDSAENSPAPSGLFSGFKGFSSTGLSSSGLSSTFKSSPASASSTFMATGASPPLSSKPLGSVTEALGVAEPSVTANVAPVSSQSGSLSTRNTVTQEEYEARLSKLNTSFVNWINKHHEQDPLADFTPTFDDYKKHLSKLDAQLQSSPASAVSSSTSLAKPLATSSTGIPSVSSGLKVGLATNGDSNSSAMGSGPGGLLPTGGASSSKSAFETTKSVTFQPISTSATAADSTLSSSVTSSSLSSSKPAAGGLFAFTAGGNGGDSSLTSSSSSGIGSSLKLASSGITFPSSCLKPSSTSDSSSSGVLSNLAPATSAGSGFFSGLVSSSAGIGGLSSGSSALGGGVPSFLLGGANKAAAGTSGGDGDDEDEADVEKDNMEPQEFDQDADIVHHIRAKLFYKKGQEWSELGLGVFKIINMDGKTQLLMRNTTRLGTILLNVMLSKTTPCSRSGKNNVMLVTVPNPPLNRKGGDDDAAATPVPFLIRVKTKEDADELHQKITDRKGE